MRPLAKCYAWTILFFCLGIFQSYSQVVIGNRDFETRTASEIRVQGDLVLIGNAITGLSSDPNGNNNTPGNNNGQTVSYIDIDGFVDENSDGDDDTFSSSSARFTSNGVCSRIVYAGLYWSATYYIEKTSSNNPVTQNLPLPDPRPDFRSVKLRVPGAANYVDIPVEADRGVIYDGYRNSPTNPNDRAAKDIPYVCYADITDIVSGLTNPDGDYTIANIRSATGTSGPGISSGWTMVIIYEDPTDTEKFISTRDGFRQIASGNGGATETFLYDNFQTLPAPLPVKARYGIAALEGDTNITGDGLAINAEPLGGFPIPLTADPVNTPTNFFNSSISVDGNYNTARNPASENTLGFDIDILDIPNTGNSIIGNDQTQVEFTASTSGDSYSVFLSTFTIEIIEPKLDVFKRVLDINGMDITGGDVVLGQQLFYEFTVQNNGNENITSAFINDILPANVDYVGGTITTPSGVTATLTNGDREVRFDFDDDVVERFDGPLTIRFGVQVINSCSEIRDACSNEIENIARSTYTGVISGITNTGEDSVLGQDVCQFDVIGTSNFLINLDSCDGNFSAFLCTGTLDLVAGGGFPTYTWTDVGTGAVIGNDQTLTVSTGGVYRVDKTGNPDCADLFEIWTVTAFNTVTNPIIPIANDPGVNGNIRTCPITGDPLPEIFLCGATDTQYLDSGFVDATNIVWERLDPAACPAVVRDEDCPTLDSTCDPDWVQVATTRDFTVTEAGEYRIRVEFDGNCDIDFYFNVFKNNFEPNLVIVRDIVCAVPGTLRVQNSSNEYEYQLITPISGTVIGYQASPEFTGLTEQGTYTVNVRQSNGLPTACVFQATQFMEELDSTVSITPVNPSCPSDQGEIQIQVTDGDSNYTYNISSTTTAFTASEGPTTDPNHIFTGLDADVYDVEVLSYDGECIDTQQITISPAAAFTASAILVRDLQCNPDYQPNINLNDPDSPEYDPTAPPYDPDEFIALIEINVTGGSGNFDYSINNPTFQLLSAEPPTTNVFRFTTAGTYTITVTDQDTSCFVEANPVIVNPYTPIEVTVAGTDPVCGTGLGSIIVTVTAGTGPYIYDLDRGSQTITSNSTTQTFNAITAGTHFINVSDIFGCPVDEESVTITNSTSLTADIAITEEYRCDDTTGLPFIAGEITVSNPQNGNGNYEYSIDGVDFTNTTGIFTGLTDGTYTLYIRDTDTAACPVNLGDLTIDPLQEVTDLDFTLSQVQCPALESTVVVSATGTNGASSFEYRIIAPAGSVTAFSTNDTYTLPAGDTYTFEARTTTDGCIYTENITIDNIDAIAVNGTATAEPTCNLDTDGSLSFEVTGVDLTVTTYSYTVTGGNIPIAPIIVNNINTTPTPITSLGAGTYTITVTDDMTNCTATDTVIITEPTVLGFTEVVDAADCGASTGIITITGTGGRGGYEYELRDAAGVAVIVAYQASNIFTGLAGGTYTVFIRDGNSAAACEFSRQVVVGQTSPGSILAVAGGDACYDNTNQASQWITITGGVGPYTYILDGNAPVAVVFLGAPANTFEITGLTPGTYNIFVNDVNNCSTPDITFTIADELTLSASLTKDLTCEVGNEDAIIDVVTSGGNGGNVFTVDYNGGPDPLFTGTFPYSTNRDGTYVITVTDGATPIACQASDTIIVSPAPAPVATVVPTDIFCNGDTTGIITFTIDTTVGTGPYETSIDNGGTFSSQTVYSGLAAGTYNYVVRDAKQCTLTGSVTVDEPDAITADIRATPVSCAAGAFSYGTVIVENVLGGTTGVIGYTYTLYNSDGTLVTAASALPAVFTTGNTVTTTVDNFTFGEVDFGSYYITIEDENSCLITTSTVTVSSPPDDLDIVANPGISDCNATGAVYDIAIINGARDYEIRIVGDPTPLGTFSLTNGLATTFPGPPFVPDATVGGNLHRFTGLLFGVSYIVEIRDAGGCIYRETLPPQTNVASPTVTEDILGNISCNGLSDGFITVDVTAFAGVGLQWELFNSATGVSVLTGNDPAATDPYSLNIPNLGIGSYTLAVATPTDPFCTGTINFSITEPPVLDILFVSQTAANCNIDAEVTVVGQGGTPPYQYAAVLDGAAAPVIGDYGPSGTLVLDPALGLDWDIYVIDSNATPNPPGVPGSPGFCSAGPLDVTITETPDPLFTSVPTFVDDPCTFDNNYTFTVTATGVGQLEYGIDDGDAGTADVPVFVTDTPNDGSFEYTVTGPGVYTITVRDANGCEDTATITVFEELLVDADFTTEPNCRTADGEITVTVTGGSDFTVNPGNFTFVLTGTDSGGAGVGPISQVGAGANVFTLVSVGTYTVTVTDAGIGPAPGCSASDDVTRAIPTDPTVALTSDDPDCVGATDGFILVTTPVGTDTPYTYQLFDFTGGVQGLQIGLDQTDDPLFDGLGAGEYLVVVTSTITGCSAQNNITLVDPTQVIATVSQTPYSCAADNSDVFPDITVTITDGTPDYTISYTGPSITVTNQPVTDADGGTPGVQYVIDADVAGNYDITVFDDNNCPFVVPTEVVNPFPIMTNPTVTLVDRITCDAPNAEVVTVSVDRILGNVAGFEFDLLPVGGADVQVIPEDVSGTTSATFNLPGVGSYVIRITDLDTGCSIDTAPYDVAPFDTIVATAALATEVACFGDLNGEISLDVSMYTGAYNYTVTNTVTGINVPTATNVLANTAVNPVLISNLPAGTYEIFVEALDTPFCDETTNRVTLASPAELMVVVNPVSDETCNPGDDASIQAVGTGGTGTIDYQLEQPAGTPIVVYGVNTTGLFENLDAGTYTVSVRDASLCEASQDITINAPVVTSVVAVETSSLLCFDSVDAAITATASGGQGAGTYLFSITNPNGTTSAQFTSITDMYVFTDLGPGTYTVRVTDNLNCESTVDVTITAPTEVTVTVETIRDPSCTDPTADIQVTGLGGTPPYEYSIDGITFVAGDTFTSLIEGDYQFYVRDANGCIGGPSNTVPVRAPEDLAVVLDLGNTSIICFSQATGSIDSEVTGGLGNYMYTLTGTDYLGVAVNIGPQPDSFFGDLLAGDYVYSVTSEDCGPEDTPFTITQPTEFVAIATTEDITCNGETDGRIVVTATGGTAPYFYSLYDSAGNALFTFLEDDIDGVAGEHIFDELAADTYRVEVEDINGCPETILDLIINEPLAIDGTVLSTTPESCAGFADGTATVSITGGTVGPDPLNPVYYWSIDGVTYQQVIDPTNLLITNLPGGITTLFIRDFNNSPNCEFPLNLDITPGVNLGAVMSTRMDCPVIDPISGNVTDEIYYIDFILDDNTVTTGTITYYLINPADGSIVANNTTGTFVVDPGTYEGLVTHDPSLCDMMVPQIEVVEYTPLSVPIAQMTGNPQDPNEYEIIVTGGSGDYTYFVAIIPNGLTVNDLTDADYRELDSNIFSIEETAEYALRVLDNMGCDVVGVQELTFINIVIPNYFTPDGDGTNDLWYPRQDSSNPGSDPFFFTDMEVKVFDRYGRLLAEFVGDEEGWNGIYQGSELPSGDYWFTIILNDIDNREFTGHFTLYR